MPKTKPDKTLLRMRSKWRADLNKAIDLVGLAQTYVEDGALITGAERLREAADLFQSAGVKRNAMLDRLVKS